MTLAQHRHPERPRRLPGPEGLLRRPTPVAGGAGRGRRPFQDQASCLSLVWAMRDRASHGWRGLTITPKGLRPLQDLRQLLRPPAGKEVIGQAVPAAAWHHRDSAPGAVDTAREGEMPPSYPVMICASGRCAIHRCSTGRCASRSTRVGWEVRSVNCGQPDLKADHGARRSPGFELVGEVDAAGRQSGGGCGRTGWDSHPLECARGDGLAGVEQVTTLFFEQRCEEARGVDRVGVLRCGSPAPTVCRSGILRSAPARRRSGPPG